MSHGWISHDDGRRTRGHYGGESEDGKYFLMKYANGPMNTVQWFRADQVEFDTPHEPVYKQPSAPTVKRLERRAQKTDSCGS